MGHGTDGKWLVPAKLKSFQLAITYNNGVLRSYINGLADQYIEVEGLSLSNITLGTCKENIDAFKIFKRALTQAEIQKLNDK